MMELSVFRDHLLTMTDLLATETSALMTERPRFAHSVLVLADRTPLPGERLKANFVKQLDPVWIQNVKASLPNAVATEEDAGIKREGENRQHQQDEAVATSCCLICHRPGHAEAEHFRQTNSDVETMATVTPSSFVAERKSVDHQGTDDRFLQHHYHHRHHHQRVHVIERSASDIPRERPWFASTTTSEDRGETEPRTTATRTRQPQTQLVEEHFERIVATQNGGRQMNELKELCLGRPLNSGQALTEKNFRHRSAGQTTVTTAEVFPSERREKLQRSSSSHVSDATIAEAIRILEASCRMLNDATAKYAQRQHEASLSLSGVTDKRQISAPSANVYFHSMNRAAASNACSGGSDGGRVFPRNEHGYRSLGGTGTSGAYGGADSSIGHGGESVTRTTKMLRERITVEHF